MLNQATINEMREMHLSAMADAYQIQMEDQKMKDLSFDERLGILVNAEYSNRKSNKLKRLLHDANLEISTACIPGIEFNAQRKLDRNLILQLASCDYILEKRNIFITDATGSGKTYLSCAFGHEACTHYLSTIFVRIPDLLGELRTAAGDAEELRNDRKLMKVIEKYTKPKLLIDAKHYSKIISDRNYHPNEYIVYALAIAFELNLNESEKLLKSAGYSFSPNSMVSVAVKFFIENHVYDREKIDFMMESFDIDLLPQKLVILVSEKIQMRLFRHFNNPPQV